MAKIIGICSIVVIAACSDVDEPKVAAQTHALSTAVINGITTSGTSQCDGPDSTCAVFNYTYDCDPCDGRTDAANCCIAAGICYTPNPPSDGCEYWGGAGCGYGTVTTAYCLDPSTAYCVCTCDTQP